MTESIQICARPTDRSRRRRVWLAEAAEAHGRLPAHDPHQASELLDTGDDTAAVLLVLPWLDDAELLEAVWALGRALDGPTD